MKIWGRNNSVNVQKVMWAVGELGLPHERIDVGGAFGKNKEPAYLAMNPNGLVPVLEEDDGFTLWESNSIVRYLAEKHDNKHTLTPKDAHTRGRAQMWMDWQLSVAQPGIHAAFWGLIRTPPEKRDNAAIATSQQKTIDNMRMLDTQLGKTKFVAADEFTYGDIPVGLMAFRYWKLVPERPELPNLRRWYDAISSRAAFQKHVDEIPFT